MKLNRIIKWICFSFLCALFFALSAQSAETKSLLSAEETEVLRFINKERSKAKLGLLETTPEIYAIASDWAQKMAEKEKMRHRKNLPSFLKKNKWRKINENVYYSYPNFDAAAVVEAWMQSPGHRKNLLMPDISIAGIGVAVSKEGIWYAAFNGVDPRPPKRIYKKTPVQQE